MDGLILIDLQDEYLLKAYRWYVHKHKGYVETAAYDPETQATKTVKLHRVVMDAEPGQVVDHINGNKLDNRRENLRICTQAENCRNNRKLRANKTSHYKGVSWNSRYQAWVAQIQANGKKLGLGTYSSEEDAARAYDEAAERLHGEFASKNFPLRVR